MSQSTSTPQSSNTAPAKANKKPGPLQRRDIIEGLMETTELGRKEVMAVSDALMAMLRQAILDGRDVRTPQFGHLKLNKKIAGASGDVHMLRVMLAEDDEKL
ncbi:MAG: HU family DNA-binding protein [Marinibacterium sp.]|nr:HU family DNA-binding protein [Marinibacterium sp.]